MADRWEVHQLRKGIRSLPPARAEEFMKKPGDNAADDWVFRARDAQLPPPDLSWGRLRRHRLCHIAARLSFPFRRRPSESS
jgi:hypothetical protein